MRIGMQVEVYKNLHRSRPGAPVYSIRSRRTRKVVGHAERIYLHGASFKVSEAGRQRVLRERSKNVHAVVSGTLVSTDALAPREQLEIAVSYNPYKGPDFFVRGSGESIFSADAVLLDSHGVTARIS